MSTREPYPFLQDDFTIQYICESKVLFLMRGLPGSGKSTVVDQVRALPKYADCAVCSADDFFLHDGGYDFDHNKLSEAHEECQRKAREACERNTNVVIIDNTNIRRWEMSFYVQLARDHDYTVVMVLPNTSWRFDPVILAQKNKHKVPVDMLEKKVQSFEVAMPFYFGWFLNETGTNVVMQRAILNLAECIQLVPEFASYMKAAYKLPDTSSINLGGLYKWDASGYHIAHCTAHFAGRSDTSQENLAYVALPAVKNSMGKAFRLTVIGFIFTPRTAGARIRLTTQQLQLWKKDDTERPPITTGTATVSLAQNAGDAITEKGTETEVGKSDSCATDNTHSESVGGKRSEKDSEQGRIVSKVETSNLFSLLEAQLEEICEADSFSGRQKYKTLEESCTGEIPPNSPWEDLKAEKKDDLYEVQPQFSPTSGLGSRAHLTLGVAGGYPAVTTGFDLIDVIQCEAQSLTDPSHVTGSEAAFRYYGEGRCVVYLDKPFEVGSLFSGCY